MVTACNNYGLLCHPSIAWLIRSEPDLHRHLGLFLSDRTNGNTLDVAGPPTEADVARAKTGKHDLELPVVRLTFRKTVHHLTGNPCLQVKASDEDVLLIEHWQKAAMFKAMQGAGHA